MARSLFLLLFILASCGSSMMTMQSFSDIPIGTSIDELKATAGSPYRVHTNKKGEEVYEYVEKFNMGYRTLEERHYFIVIRDGRVVEKKLKYEEVPPYYIDSYQMQTSSLEEESEQKAQ
jgi:hypothetical protein